MNQTKSIASDELLMAQLQNLDWKQLWVRLTGRCFWLLRKRYTVKWPSDEVKKFSRKIIGEVINKIFIEKKRNWNTDRYPDFEEFIVGVIDSHVNNTLKKEGKEFTIGDNEFLLDENGESEPDVQEIVITEELRNQIYYELEASGADDDELLIFECLADGIHKPEDIRKELGINDEDFHNAWRRLKRKRKTIQEKLAANGY
ncbi:MAG: hypothetical protein KDC74_08685 [Flavobacteriaceae bacterium]|jgi:hypothetical protein|nr:hypothetical protein [Flavobacteriaceae bacterium]MCB0486492.1 hypothetical protein [Flavobacteriaceae bacterium]